MSMLTRTFLDSPMIRFRVFSFIVSVSVLVFAVSAHAQSASDSTRSEDLPPALQEGGWGLQYEATSLNGALSGFQGSLFAGRYHFSSRAAMRVGVSLNVESSETERTRSNRSVTDRTEEDTQDYLLFSQYLRYFHPTERGFVFVGVGPRLGFRSTTNTETEEFENRNRKDVQKTEQSRYRIGLGGAVGVEWFVHSNISLSAEYPLRFDYVHRNVKETVRRVRNGSVEDEATVEEDTDRYVFGGQRVRVGVTFSFGP